MLVVVPPLFNLLMRSIDPVAYGRYYNPYAAGSIVIAGIVGLIFERRKRQDLAWLYIAIFATVSGFFMSGMKELGPGYSISIYLIAAFLVVLTLPQYGWPLITSLVVLATTGRTFLNVVTNPHPDLSTELVNVCLELIIVGAGIFVAQMLHRHLNAQNEQFRIANESLEKANRDLRDSQYKSHILMETGLDPFFLVRPNGDILEVNQRACDLLGYSAEEFLELSAEDIAPVGTPERLAWIYNAMHKHGELKPLRTQLIKKDGTQFEGEVYGRLLQIDDERTMYMAARDITHILEHERNVREKSDLLEMITQNLPARIAYFDADSNLHFHNRAFADAYQPDLDAERVHASTMITPEQSAMRAEHVSRVLEGKPVHFQLTETSPDGKLHVLKKIYVPHFDNGHVVGRVSLGIDITELHETQKSLEENNTLLDHVLNSMPARIAYVAKNGDVRFVNNQLFEQFGIRPESAIGRKVRDIMPASYMETIDPYVRQAFHTGKELIFETTIQHANDVQVVERSYYYPHVVNDRVEALFSLHMDVTNLRETEDALNRAQKLESLGVLAGGIAHDFNNLLVAIMGQSSLALAKIEEGHPGRRHIVSSVSAAKRASILTQQMLAYSGRGSFSIDMINLNELISGNLALFEVSIPKNIQLVTNLHDNLPPIEADTAQMQQLIMNLIINAGQAIGTENGQITITTRVQNITEKRGEFWEITGDPLVPGRYVSVEVQDTGSGMSKKTISQIFDPFYTTKESGTGLGLAAALGIIRGHFGGIHVYSEVGRGTVFHLLFPAHTQVETMVVDVADVDSAEISQARHTVLVIDDETDILHVVDDMLDLHNISTLQAPDGQSGVDLYRQHKDEISLVLLDLMMPGLSSEDTLLALREINPNVQVILSSGYNELEATRQFTAHNLTGFVQKPYDFETLVTHISSVIGRPPPVTTL